MASGDNKWQWQKVKKPQDSSSSSSSSSPSLLKGRGAMANGTVMSNGGPGAEGEAGGGAQEYRWRHTEAVKLLERALAVHREVRSCGM